MFPRTRDKMKLVLEDIGLPFYDTFMIIEKTGAYGRGRFLDKNREVDDGGMFMVELLNRI